MSYEYVETPITVEFNRCSICVQISHLSDKINSFLRHILHRAGATHSIGLDVGVGMTLCSRDADNTRWVWDCQDLKDD